MMFLRDGRRQPCNRVALKGILLYVGADNLSDIRVETIVPAWHEIRSLVIVRNSLACSLKTYVETNVSSRPKLPPLLRSKECEFCFQAAECMTYHKCFENGTEITSGIPVIFLDLTMQTTSQHGAYIRKWDRLIDLEAIAQTSISPIHYIWTRAESSPDKCITGLDFISYEPREGNIEAVDPVQAQNTLCFTKSQKAASVSTSNPSSSKRRLMIGDRVIISAEKRWESSSASQGCPKSQRLQDIEDIATKGSDAQIANNLMNVLPHVSTGYIAHLSEDALTIMVHISGDIPPILRRYAYPSL
jgi:hypothetical protein